MQQPTGVVTQHLQTEYGYASLHGYHYLTLCSLLGIGSGQRQLIAVTCIAEHA